LTITEKSRMRKKMTRSKFNLEEYIQEHYDYIGIIDIAKINREFLFGATIKECKEIHDELYEWS